MFSYISERNIRSMLGGNLIAVLLISMIMMLALRSLPIGAMSLVLTCESKAFNCKMSVWQDRQR